MTTQAIVFMAVSVTAVVGRVVWCDYRVLTAQAGNHAESDAGDA